MKDTLNEQNSEEYLNDLISSFGIPEEKDQNDNNEEDDEEVSAK